MINTTHIAPCPNRASVLVTKTNNEHTIDKNYMIKYDDSDINGVWEKCGRRRTKSISEHQARLIEIPYN